LKNGTPSEQFSSRVNRLAHGRAIDREVLRECLLANADISPFGTSR